MTFNRGFFYLVVSLITTLSQINFSHAQGIRGVIVDENQEPLPFATIYVRSIESGATSNSEGFYEVKLAPGKYDIIFQFLGYESLIKVVTIDNDFTQLDIQLTPQSILLQSVVVSAKKKDPALTIMRKAIASAKYHVNQLDAFSSQVYTKGSGRLIKSPFLLRKRIEKEGIDSTAAFTSESIVEIDYKRPNQIKERVISIRSSGNSNQTSPTPFINGSFYNPEIAGAISPLSPYAFNYYKFVYQGTFIDRGYAVSKIKVIPRSKGDDLFFGEISIIEDEWSIHSVNLKTTKFGIKFWIRQIYDPIENKVWLPISHKFDVNGKFLGFEFEYDYLATVSKYQITMNPELEKVIEIIDEKVDKELAKEVKISNKKKKNTSTINQLKDKDKLTRKDFNKLINEYEKIENEQNLDKDIISISSRVIDSTAYNNDSLYWAQVRPVPLNKYEVKGYQVTDSITNYNENAAKGDTLKTGRRKGFGLGDLILGNTYKIGDRTHLRIKNSLLLTTYNTVEGFSLKYGLQFTKTFKNKNWLSIEPTIRYGIARDKLIGDVNARWRFKNKGAITLLGGRSIDQYNANRAIHPAVNSLTSLFLEQNFLKIYEQDHIDVRYNSKIGDRIKYEVGFSSAQRRQLFNNTDYSFIDVNNREFTPNPPTNDEIPNTEFPTHNAAIAHLSIEYTPIVKYVIRNGVKRPTPTNSPIMNFQFKDARFSRISDVRFTSVDLGIKHSFGTNAQGKFSYKVNGGFFFNNDLPTFIDFKHFKGNRIFIQGTDPTGSYRLLDYYRNSTADNYISTFAHYEFRRLILTRLPFVQEKGLKESLFINYLGTKSSENYTEVGYSINNLFRFFRLEGIAVFKDGQYYDWGVRIGVSTSLSNFISVN